MNTETLLWFLVGLAGLAAGAELLVRGSSRLAVSLGISPLVVGLTIVALGTSAPELSVSIKAALVGQPDLAFGNVVGSNIFNVLVVLGLSAVVAPLVVDQKLVRLEVPLMIVAAIAMCVMALNHMVGRVEGIILVLGLVGYTVLLLVKGRDETPDIEAEYASEYSSSDAGTLTGGRKVLRAVVAGAMSAVGLVLLVVGSDWLVAGSVATARWLGVSELVIGLTLVAGGTSLPELATSSRRHSRENVTLPWGMSSAAIS
jgi:cation:H+ antiporter